jgi:hypothetical protein
VANTHNDRVRANTPEELNLSIDSAIGSRVRQYATAAPRELEDRIDELDREWDIERILQLNAAALAFTGMILGLTQSRRWFAIPGLVLPFLFQHAVQGWCPPVPALRWLGVRTRREIDREKYALKALRGDFDLVTTSGSPDRVDAVLAAVER